MRALIICYTFPPALKTDWFPVGKSDTVFIKACLCLGILAPDRERGEGFNYSITPTHQPLTKIELLNWVTLRSASLLISAHHCLLLVTISSSPSENVPSLPSEFVSVNDHTLLFLRFQSEKVATSRHFRIFYRVTRHVSIYILLTFRCLPFSAWAAANLA